MSPTSSDPSCQPQKGIHPLLRGIAIESRAVAVRLLAYLSGLAMLAFIAADLMSAVGPDEPIPEAAVPAWSRASRADRAFALSLSDLAIKPEAYEAFRRPDGSRKDVLRWAGDSGLAVAEIAIVRLGGSPGPDPDGLALAPPAGLAALAEAEPAGRVETKFGSVPLWHVAGTAPACLGFAKDFEAPRLMISGWSCAAPARAAQQSLIGCALDRLTLLSAGNNPALAALFARAELKRGACGTSLAAADWITEAAPPRLRGRL